MIIQLELFPAIIALIILVSTIFLVRNVMELGTILLKQGANLNKSVNEMANILVWYKTQRRIDEKNEEKS